MSDALRSLGYSPVEAEDGNSGIAALERERPDVLILDYAMPGMTGAEVAREARVRGHDLPIVFSTGFAETAAIETVLGRNAPVLRKPFRISRASGSSRHGPVRPISLVKKRRR